MRVGIYNRWLATLGGGERVTIDLARALALDGAQVDLLAHQPLDLAKVGQRLAIDLDTIAFRAVADSPANQRLSAVSAEYDLLINASHGDLFPARSAKSALYVHFPQPLLAYSAGGQPRFARGSAQIAPSTVRWIAGMYPPESDGVRSWSWTGSHARMEVIRRWPRAARVLLLTLDDLRPAAVPPPVVRVLVNGVCVGERSDDWSAWPISLPQPIRRGQVATIELEATPWTLRDAGVADDDRERGVALQSVALLADPWEARLFRSLAAQPWSSIQPTDRDQADVSRALDSYTVIVANSAFTRRWIERRWQRQSTVIYPAVDLSAISALPKQPIILSVGRFFAGAHNKKHLPMIQAFRALCEAGLTGWHYHLVGGCDLEQPEQRGYLAEVEAAAAGYPITLHVNAPLADLRRCYGAASIFWHATGYGEDEERDPDSFEHFGITTIEAMAAGCVPVVIARAGQLETVVAGESGLLWNTLDELQSHTKRLIADPALWRQLSAAAAERSRSFGFDSFARRVQEILGAESPIG